MSENALFSISMLAIGVIFSCLQCKFHISKKIWDLLKISNLYIQLVIFIIIVVILAIVSMIICTVMLVPESIDKVVMGIIMNMAFVVLPFEVKQIKK